MTLRTTVIQQIPRLMGTRESRAAALAVEARHVNPSTGLIDHYQWDDAAGDTFHWQHFSDGSQEVWRAWDAPSGEQRLVAWKQRGKAWRYFWAED